MKKDLLSKLYTEYIKEFNEEEVVEGGGNPDSGLLFVGEAPGKDEVKQGKPFVGTAGQNLDEFLECIGLGRDSIYITNAIKYRLSKLNKKTGRLSNRPARKEEILGSQRYLFKEVEIIKPSYVVTLGNVPLRAVTGTASITIGNVHGDLQEVDILGHKYNLFPLYHPASIIYNRSLKEVFLEDLQKLKSEVLKEQG